MNINKDVFVHINEGTSLHIPLRVWVNMLNRVRLSMLLRVI